MKFIDEAILEVKAGHGGRGCSSFRRERGVPQGGPDGGNGGRGGHVIFRTKEGLGTLMDVRYRRLLRGKDGGHGKGKQMNGPAGEDCIAYVPIGTTIYDNDTEELIADLDKFPMELVIAKGGRGGLGNMNFARATQQAPTYAQPGEEGKERKVRVELRLLADVGLLGFPNAGKSTLISCISNSRPKIADYPFTTKVPNLGVVELGDYKSCVVADIPGLIEGASEGIGMGFQFLRHVERTKVLLHLIDIMDPAHPDPVVNYQTLRRELKTYNKDLLKHPELIILTKMDVTENLELAKLVKQALRKKTKSPIITISAVKKEGLQDVLNFLREHLLKEKNENETTEDR